MPGPTPPFFSSAAIVRRVLGVRTWPTERASPDRRGLVRIGDFFIAAGALTQVAERTRAHLQAEPKLTVAAFRDLLGTSRKYALPLLEWLDEAKITRRSGEERVPGPNA
jgi:selenocysteine-specific elongation factor